STSTQSAGATTSAANPPPTRGYVGSGAGVVATNPFGLCWRMGSDWTPDKAAAPCDAVPRAAVAPVPVAAAPAPAPTPIVAAAPLGSREQPAGSTPAAGAAGTTGTTGSSSGSASGTVSAPGSSGSTGYSGTSGSGSPGNSGSSSPSESGSTNK